MRSIIAGLVALTLPVMAAKPAKAESNEVRFAIQFAFAYLQINVMKHENLVQKHAKLLGLPGDVKTTFAVFNGGDAMNDALISGAVDFVGGGVPAMLVLWDRTRGTPQEVRGVSALGYFDLLLNTRAAHVKSIKDFKEGDKIAVPAVKVSGQALILQMAAAKEWGFEHWERLDKYTFSLSQPDQAAGMLANNPAFETAFGAPPATLQMLKNPSVRTIMKSSDLVGDATSSVWWSTKRFRDANPKLYQAVINATKEAQTFIDKDLPTAMKYFIEDAGSKATVEELVTMIRQPGYGYHIAPQGFMAYAEFMQKIGRLKNKPESWKDMFFPEIHDLKGS